MDVSLSEALDGLILDRRVRGRSTRTTDWYEGKLKAFIDWAASRRVTTFKGCTKPLVYQYLLQRGDITPQTRNGYVRAIKVLAHYALDEDLISASPLLKLDQAKVDLKFKTTLRGEDIERFLGACVEPTKARDQALALFLYDTGVRLGEALRLTEDHLRLKEGYAVVLGKGRRERVVAFGSRTSQAVWRYMRKRKPASSVVTEVFLNTRGRPMGGNSTTHQFQRIAKRAGLERANPHLFRHSSATEMLRNGAPTAAVQRLLGHAQITTTEIYLHMLPGDVIAAHRRASPADHI